MQMGHPSSSDHLQQSLEAIGQKPADDQPGPRQQVLCPNCRCMTGTELPFVPDSIAFSPVREQGESCEAW
jgi:hypothetical protein